MMQTNQTLPSVFKATYDLRQNVTHKIDDRPTGMGDDLPKLGYRGDSQHH